MSARGAVRGAGPSATRARSTRGVCLALGALAALAPACGTRDNGPSDAGTVAARARPAVAAADTAPTPGPATTLPHSGPIAVNAAGTRVYVAHPDADSVTFVDPRTRAVVREVLLADAPPARDPRTHRYDPSVAPRALALDEARDRLYVTGQRSGRVYALDANTGAVLASVDACSEPVGVLASPDGARVFVACSQDDAILALRAADLAPDSRAGAPRKPWALAFAPDGSLLATHLLGPGVSVFATTPLARRATFTLADGPPGSDARVPHGEVRGLYDVAVRPGTRELWVLHTMLGTDTPQPALDFERTVFPAITVLDERGAQLARLSVHTRPGDHGALGDVVSGPRAIAFSPDGRYAYIADADSEDLLVVDAARRVEAALIRPLPGHLPEGLALGAQGALYLYQRNTEDLAVLDTRADPALPELAERAVPTLARDPMPAELRTGQRVFYSANSDELPVTENHWVACASCHLEGRSDAVTWRFAQGPRDTPSNAGGTRDTGFLFRTGDRTSVRDYWRTANLEQGGHVDPGVAAHASTLAALTAFVDDAIPTPVPPRTDPGLRARGERLFAQTGCARCHSGGAYTDSAAGNPRHDLRGPVVLHDVGTCRTTGPAVDVAHQDRDGHPRAACAFDTPALRGLVDTAPYLHDGSAATLEAVLQGPAAHVGPAAQLGPDDRRALIEFLRSL